MALTIELPRIDAAELRAKLDAWSPTWLASILGVHRSTVIALRKALDTLD